MGMMDVESFAPIINPGESAILAMASAKPQPVVRDGNIVVRQMMKLTLSCDHRIVDGALGAKFINAIKQKLEDIVETPDGVAANIGAAGLRPGAFQNVSPTRRVERPALRRI